MVNGIDLSSVTTFPPEVVTKIMNYHISLNPTEDDYLVWNLTNLGKFSLASVVDFLQNENNDSLISQIDWPII